MIPRSKVYKKILLPHAGTPAGDDALKHAVYSAKSSKAEILILHVVEDMPRVPMGFALDTSQMDSIKRKLKEATRDMKAVMQKEMSKRVQFCKKNKIKAELKVTSGNTADEILKIVRNQRIDLIVMAKRRKLKGIKRIMTLGSVSRKILEHVSCPVLIIDAEKK